jgi:hypothetical protein
VHYPDYLSSPDCSLVANAARDLGEFLFRRRLDHPEAAPAAGHLRARWPAPRRRADPADAGEAAARDDRAPAPLRIGYHQP